MPHAKLCRWYLDVPGTSRYAFNAKFPSELLAPWYRTFNPPRDKWNIQVVTMAQGSPNDVSRFNVHRQKKTCPLILGSHCQKERVFKPRFFPWNMLLFDLFGGITIFQTPHGFSIVILYMQAYKWTQIRTTRIHGLLSRPHFEILQIQEPWKRHTSCFCWTSFAGFWSMRPWAQIFAGCQEM